MAAAPLPKSDGDASPSSAEARAHPEPDGWQLLDSMRRRLDEQVAQTRKTQGQVTQLAESVAALVGEQRKRSRWLNINSFVAYVLFTLLLGGAFYFLYQSRARELVSSRDKAVAEREAAVRKADEATSRLVARESAEARAWEIYQLIVAGHRDEVAKRMEQLKDAPLSKLEREVLADRGRQADTVHVDVTIKSAIASFKANKFGEAVAPLEQALSIETAGPKAAELHYLLGIALAKTNELDKAITHLQKSIELDVADDDARFQLASALDRAGQWGKARVEYDRFATAHPQSPSAIFAMRRSATLARMPAVAGQGGAQPGLVQPAAGQPGAGQPGAARPAAPANPAPKAEPASAPAGQPNGGQPPAGQPSVGQAGSGQSAQAEMPASAEQ